MTAGRRLPYYGREALRVWAWRVGADRSGRDCQVSDERNDKRREAMAEQMSRVATGIQQGTATGLRLRSGAAAGASSALVFTLIHDLLISDIWFSLAAMLGAGAICGLCVAWSYRRLVARPSLGGWLGYNMVYVATLGLLGVASVVAFEPVTTIGALVAANGPPDALIGQALPMTALFTLLSAGAISLLYRGGWPGFGATLLTSTVLVLLLGLNVSAIGLVFIPRGSLYLIGELFGLIVALNVVYAGIFAVLERRKLGSANRAAGTSELDSATP